MKHFRILSLFDGISCGQEALNRVMGRTGGYRWFASEIDKYAIAVTNFNYPDTIQVGDVRYINPDKFRNNIDLIIGGSPCQNFSFAGTKKGMTTTDNIEITTLKKYLKLKEAGFQFEGESYLFWEFVRLVKDINPTYFILENVKMNKRWEDVITRALGVSPIRINSKLLSAQNRDRLYWTNIPGVTIPDDRCIQVGDIIPGATAGYGGRGTPDGHGGYSVQKWTERKDGKANCLTKSGGSCDFVKFVDGRHRKLTPDEYDALQGLPIGYTDVPGVSDRRRKGAVGNGMTVDVIEHILSFVPELVEIPEYA